jgi:sugar phosphate permease
MYLAWALAGTGAGLTISSCGVLLLAFTTDEQRGADSAALQLADVVLSAITTGVAGVLLAAAARAVLGYTAAFVVLDAAMAVLAAVGILVAGQARPPAPAAP